MAQATATYTVTVKAGAQTGVITITPSSGQLPDETEGVSTSDEVAVVSVDANVVLPLQYTFSGQPDGVSFQETDNGDGTFTIQTAGAPAVGSAGDYTIDVVVSDSGPSVAPAKANVTVRKL